MIIHKILNEMAEQCKRIQQAMFEGLDFLEGNLISKDQEEKRTIYMEKVGNLAQLHLEICQCAKNANKVFGIPFMTVLICEFCHITLTLYDICNEIVNLNLNEYNINQIIKLNTDCLQVIMTFCRQILAIYSWTHLRKQLKETILDLHKLWNILSINNQIGKWAGSLQLATIQLSNAIPRFCASGMLIIDWPILISIMSAASTYVVILIQFGSIKRNVALNSGAEGAVDAPGPPTFLLPA